MQTILITGGSGMIGTALTRHFSGQGHQVIILTRKLPRAESRAQGVTYSLWDPAAGSIDLAAVQQADAIVHLAGAGVVDRKWTDEYKSEIVRSRTETSALLVRTLQDNDHHVKAVVSASAIGWYGEDPPPARTGFTEQDPATSGFLGQTCRQWEESIAPVENAGCRLVTLRTGIVLSNEGGALPEFKRPVQLGVAGILGNGRQVVSWIHIDDLCRMYMEAIENEQMRGIYNAVAPLPVSNETLTTELARQLKGRFFIPVHVPAFALKLLMGERSTEVLKSTTVSNEKITRAGFKFLYPTIEDALKQLCHH